MTTVSWYTKIRSNRIASVTLVMLMITSVLAMLAYLVIPDKSHNANRQILQLALKAPGSAHKICYQAEDARKNNQEILYEQSLISREGRFETKELRFLLGSDKFGRDVLSRLILGLRVSLTIGFLAVIVSLFIGRQYRCLLRRLGRSGRYDNHQYQLVHTDVVISFCYHTVIR